MLKMDRTTTEIIANGPKFLQVLVLGFETTTEVKCEDEVTYRGTKYLIKYRAPKLEVRTAVGE